MFNSDRRLHLIGAIALCLFLGLAFFGGAGTYRTLATLGRDLPGVLAVLGEAGESKEPEEFRVFWEAWGQVDSYFYREPPTPRERTYGAIRGALGVLGDPYTVFIEPQPRELERDEMRGQFGGIGVDLWVNADWEMILVPYPDSPASRAGVLDGDVLLQVDGEVITRTTTIDHVRAQFHGEVGTDVTLMLSRPPTLSLQLTITRQEIRVPSVTWHMLDEASGLGYVQVEGFTERTGEELEEALLELEEAEASSLVLDLRNNYGGLVDAAVDVASQFLSDGIVLREQRRGEERDQTFSVRRGGVATDIPMVALVNEGTASAAEIVAGALQDHDRAPLIGVTTYGKGSVQLIYELSDGSSLHVTAALWLTPNEHQIEGQGLSPDVVVEQHDALLDTQLEQAIAYLQTE